MFWQKYFRGDLVSLSSALNQMAMCSVCLIFSNVKFDCLSQKYFFLPMNENL